MHPIAWWIWAIGLAVAASRTTNPLLLALVLAVLAVVVVSRRTEAPWARAFKCYLLLALFVIAIRVVFRSSSAASRPGEHVLFRLPAVPTARLHVGRAARRRGVAGSVLVGHQRRLPPRDALCCIGAANTLANPKRALRVPARRAVRARRHHHRRDHRRAAARRERAAGPRARGRLRGGREQRAAGGAQHRDAGAATTRSIDRSSSRPRWTRVGTAARGTADAWHAPGHRRSAARRHARAVRRAPTACSTRRRRGFLGVPAILRRRGAVLRRVSRSAAGACSRSQYRPDPWRSPEWIVARCGLATAIAVVVRGQQRTRRGAQPVDLPAALCRRCRCCPTIAILIAAILASRRHRRPRRGRIDGTRSARAATRSSHHRDRGRAGAGMIRFDARHDHLPRCRRAGAARRRTCASPPASCASWSARPERQVDAARRDQRAGPALHRRRAARAGSPSTAATPRTHPPRELADVVGVVDPGSARRLRHRHARGGARVRHGAARDRAAT